MAYRPAGQVFDRAEDGSFVLNDAGREVMGTISAETDGFSKVRPFKIPEQDFGTGGGFVNYKNKDTVYVDPLAPTPHVLAHEAAHSQAPIELNKTFADTIMTHGSPYKPDEMLPENVPNKAAGLRYAYEKEVIPVMLEEANAQGIARATTEHLGYGNAERPGHQDHDNLEYPLTYGDRFLADKADHNVFDDAYRKELWRIKGNMRGRAERQYETGKDYLH